MRAMSGFIISGEGSAGIGGVVTNHMVIFLIRIPLCIAGITGPAAAQTCLPSCAR